VTVADGSAVTIRMFPNDARFVRDIERAVAEAGVALPEDALRERLQARLRAWYPMVEVRARNDLAEIEPGEHLWYAMRDGHVGRPRERVDRLHAVMSDARVTSETTRVVLDQVRDTIARAAHSRGGGHRVVTLDRDHEPDVDGLDLDDEDED